jgi:hypothetical protein
MKGGDISNKNAPIIAFNIDNLLFTDKERKPENWKEYAERLVQYIKPLSPEEKLLKRELDKNFINIVNAIWYSYDFSIYFISKYDLEGSLGELLYDHYVCYTRILQYHSLQELRVLVNNSFYLYVDKDEELISKVYASNVVHIDKIFDYARPTWRRLI